MEQQQVIRVYQGSLHPPWAPGPTKTVPASIRAKLHALLWFLSIALMMAVLCGGIGALVAGEDGLIVGLMILGLFLLFGSWTAFTLQQAPCPYCQGTLGGTFNSGLTRRDDKKQLQCPHCFEWLVSHKGTVRALQDEDVLFAPLYTCPVFQHGVWPHECIVCGVPVARRVEAKTPQGETLALAAETVSDSESVVKGVPYCQAHEKQVFVHLSDRGELQLSFMDYGARRRDLAANARRVPVTLQVSTRRPR
jgi:hypothetical protein